LLIYIHGGGFTNGSCNTSGFEEPSGEDSLNFALRHFGL
jgi:hypothetical protein